MKKKILYFMSVDWNWIAQRPHFMALELSKCFDVTVLYPRFLYRPWKAQQNIKSPERCFGVPQIPFQEKNRVLQSVSNALFRKYIGDIYSYDVIWLGTPMFTRLIPDDYRGIVVYDYMDDIAALQSSKKVAAYVKKMNDKLVKRADLIMVTSLYLLNKLDESLREKAHLIRNAYRKADSGRETALYENTSERAFIQSSSLGRSVVKMGYVGTISGWMDFRLILNSLKKYSNLECHMWGPARTAIPEHERLICHGVIEHDQIEEAVQDMDCLIMPFQVNDIVMAVDPVKLYEYISFGKNTICVAYPEL